MTTQTSSREAVWSRYWQSGALHSCIGSYDGNYSGAIAQFWHSQFARMSASDTVLDIASGNCALAKLLAESTPAATYPTLHAVDISAIRADWITAYPASIQQRIVLHPLTDAANPPLPPNSVGWAISQFGFEYLDTGRMVAMLQQTLTHTAHIAMVLHHADSIITTVARAEVAHLQWLAQQPAIWAAAHGMVDLMAMRHTSDGMAYLRSSTDAKQQRQDFNTHLNLLGERVRSEAHSDILDDIARALLGIVSAAGQQCSAAESHAHLDELVTDTQATRFRLDELVQAALTNEAGEQLREALQQTLSLSACNLAPLHHEQQLLAWSLYGHRHP